nr:hypothetical protein [Nocardioides humi]
MRALAELRQLHRRQLGLGAGSSLSSATKPVNTCWPIASPIGPLAMARVPWSSTCVLRPLPSSRTQPVTVTSPSGGAGRSSYPIRGSSVPNHPRSTRRVGPPVVTSGTTTSTPG